MAARAAEHPLVVVSALAGVTDALLGLASISAERRRHRARQRRSRRWPGATRRSPPSCRGRMSPPGPCDPTPRRSARSWLAALGPASSRRRDGRGGGSGRAVELAAGGGRHGWRRRARRMGGYPSHHGDRRPIRPRHARMSRCWTTERARRLLPILAQGRIPVTQGFIGATADGSADHAGPGRLGLHRGAARRGARRRAGGDLDRRGRVDDRRSADRSVGSDARRRELRGGGRAGHLRRQGAASGDRAAAGASRHPHRGAQFLAPGAARAPPSRPPPSWSGWATRRSGRSPGSRASPWSTCGRRGCSGTYGFLRAMFEVFERHEVVVDVLASGEVSMSLTIEDRSRLEPVSGDLSELGEVWTDERRAIMAIVGVGLRHTPGLAGRVFTRGPAGKRRDHLAGRVGDQYDVRREGGRRAGCRPAAAPRVFRIRLKTSGAGRREPGATCYSGRSEESQTRPGLNPSGPPRLTLLDLRLPVLILPPALHEDRHRWKRSRGKAVAALSRNAAMSSMRWWIPVRMRAGGR